MGVAQINLYLRRHVLVIEHRTQRAGRGKEHLPTHAVDLRVTGIVALHIPHAAEEFDDHVGHALGDESAVTLAGRLGDVLDVLR